MPAGVPAARHEASPRICPACCSAAHRRRERRRPCLLQCRSRGHCACRVGGSSSRQPWPAEAVPAIHCCCRRALLVRARGVRRRAVARRVTAVKLARAVRHLRLPRELPQLLQPAVRRTATRDRLVAMLAFALDVRCAFVCRAARLAASLARVCGLAFPLPPLKRRKLRKRLRRRAVHAEELLALVLLASARCGRRERAAHGRRHAGEIRNVNAGGLGNLAPRSAADPATPGRREAVCLGLCAQCRATCLAAAVDGAL